MEAFFNQVSSLHPFRCRATCSLTSRYSPAMSLAARRLLSKRSATHLEGHIQSRGTPQADADDNLVAGTTIRHRSDPENNRASLALGSPNESDFGVPTTTDPIEYDISTDRRRNLEATSTSQTGRGKVICQTCTANNDPIQSVSVDVSHTLLTCV
jgi:hypothetical protein